MVKLWSKLRPSNPPMPQRPQPRHWAHYGADGQHDLCLSAALSAASGMTEDLYPGVYAKAMSSRSAKTSLKTKVSELEIDDLAELWRRSTQSFKLLG